HASSTSALAAVQRRVQEGWPVAAVFTADSSACGGGAFRTALRDLDPHVRRVLIVGRGEWSTAHPAVTAMRTGQAESYIFVPWGPRERWLYLPVTEVLADWEASKGPPGEQVRLIGQEWEPRTHQLRDVFSRIGIPYGFYEPEHATARKLLDAAGLDGETLPVLAPRRGRALVDPVFAAMRPELGFPTA